tara:strand:+ start:356 stop:901 length:546 start_codon:yes stop_codon:yes gene_type:complete
MILTTLFLKLSKVTYMKSYLRIILLLLIFSIHDNRTFSQTNSIQTGVTNKLTINLKNEIGVRTTANIKGDAIVTNKGEFELKEDSTIKESFSSEDDPNISGDFVVTPTGASFNLTGLVAENEYIIKKAEFSSEITNQDPITGELIGTGPVSGDASSSLFTNMVLDVEQTNSSFTTSFSSNF